MITDGFIKFMKDNKKSERCIRDYTRCSQEFNEFLLTTKRNKSIDNANPKDVNDFISIIERKSKIHRHVGSLQTYYEYIDREEMVNTCAAIMTEQWLENYKLKDFMGITRDQIEALSKVGIRNAKQLLYAGLSRNDREKLTQKTGLPKDKLLESIKLSDLARIGGMKKIRGRLYYDAGFDTITRISEHTTDEIRKRLKEYIDMSGFNGIPPTPKEAARTVSMAKHLKKIVEY